MLSVVCFAVLKGGVEWAIGGRCWGLEEGERGWAAGGGQGLLSGGRSAERSMGNFRYWSVFVIESARWPFFSPLLECHLCPLKPFLSFRFRRRRQQPSVRALCVDVSTIREAADVVF